MRGSMGSTMGFEVGKPRRKQPTRRVTRVKAPLLVLTVGHSTRTIEDFIRLIQAHGVKRVADVRTIPRSRRNPQFNADSLPHSLAKTGIGYVHLAGLGGLRRTSWASPNTGWRNTSFRGFADHMQTQEFKKALSHLAELAKQTQLALMCA